ncbi:hypothetical protein M1O57_04340 [Dehalococcoidia bacterium]|nr:hypothetical protein [Dehalococcoidia bacterium]
MKKRLSLPLLALLLVSFLAAGCPLVPPYPPDPVPTPSPFPPPDKEWDRTFGGADLEMAYSLQQTRDGGFIIAGSGGAGGVEYLDVWLVKTDQEGDKEWSRTFGGAGRDTVRSVQQTADGGFIIAGETRSFGAGKGDVWLIKTDEEGNKEWNRTFGGAGRDAAWSVQQTADGGFIIAGETRSFDAGKDDVWLIKTDEEGNKEWSRTFGGKRRDGASSVKQTTDGGFIIAGWTRSFGAGQKDFWLIRTDQDGNKEWSRTFGGRHTDAAFSAQQTRDGGFIIAGMRMIAFLGAGDTDFWLVKTDEEGNKEWSRTFGGRYCEGASSVKQTTDGGFIIAGDTKSFGAGGSDFWLVKTDEEGNKEWAKTFGGTDLDVAHSVEQTACGGFIIAGRTNSFGAGESDFWLIKLAPEE